jgi:tetratricopeptide (TPR) repeat protein
VSPRKASDLDPLNLMIGTWLRLRYYLARNYESAVEQGRNTVDLDPSFAASHLLLGEAYLQKGFREKGLAELQSAASLSGNNPLYLAQVAVAYASTGRRTEPFRLLISCRRLQPADTCHRTGSTDFDPLLTAMTVRFGAAFGFAKGLTRFRYFRSSGLVGECTNCQQFAKIL